MFVNGSKKVEFSFSVNYVGYCSDIRNVSVSAPKGINNQWHDMFFYMTLAVNKVDWRGLINTKYHECLPKKTKVTWY